MRLEIIKISSLSSNFQEERLKKQINFRKKLMRTTEKLYFNNLEAPKTVDNRGFLKEVNALFSTKCCKGDDHVLWLPLKYYSELSSLSENIHTRLLYLSVDITDISFPRLFQNVSGPTK